MLLYRASEGAYRRSQTLDLQSLIDLRELLRLDQSDADRKNAADPMIWRKLEEHVLPCVYHHGGLVAKASAS